MKRLILVVFVVLVGCSSGAFCATPNTAECPSGADAFCIAPDVDPDRCAMIGSDGTSLCSTAEFGVATCTNSEGPNCPEGWALHCYD